MFQILRSSAGLVRGPFSRSLPAFSTSSSKQSYVDPTTITEAPLIDNENVVALPEEQKQKMVQASSIAVPTQVDITPISGIPDEHIHTRRVRIYQPPKNAMQSGTNNIGHWEMEFDNRERWENPLMGWTSTGDPHSNLKIKFVSAQEAIEHCEKNGWKWFIDCSVLKREFKPKSYGLNFSWNRRTRVSTK